MAMTYRRTWRKCGFVMLAACGLLALAASGLSAQLVPANPQRDCQTIRTCNFTRGGVYRGCLSSYSCRICRFIRSACSIDGTRRICQQLRCSWG
jgi:hypothetical protein